MVAVWKNVFCNWKLALFNGEEGKIFNMEWEYIRNYVIGSRTIL